MKTEKVVSSACGFVKKLDRGQFQIDDKYMSVTPDDGDGFELNWANSWS